MKFPNDYVKVGDWVYIYDESHRVAPKLKYKVLRIYKGEKKIIVEVTQRHKDVCPSIKGWPAPDNPKMLCWNVWHWRTDKHDPTIIDNE